MKSVGHNLRQEAPQAFAEAIASKSPEHLNGQVQILKAESLHPTVGYLHSPLARKLAMKSWTAEIPKGDTNGHHVWRS